MSKKQQLLDTALKLFVERGIEATATAQIAKTAGVANGTLFHHFANKAALVNALYASTKGQLAAAMQMSDQISEVSGLKKHAQQLWQQGMQWAIDHPLQLRFLLQLHNHPSDPIRDQLTQELFGGLEQLLQLGQQHQLLASSSIPFTSHLAHGQFLASAVYISERPKNQQADTIEESFTLFWRMIGG